MINEKLKKEKRKKLKDRKLSTVATSVKATQKIHIENFVKFFREKFRVCWKEIYLKFIALVLRPERCKNCY